MNKFSRLLRECEYVVVHIDNDMVYEFLEVCESLGYRWSTKAATQFVPMGYDEGDMCILCYRDTMRLEHARLGFFNMYEEEYGPVHKLSELGLNLPDIPTVNHDALMSLLSYS